MRIFTYILATDRGFAPNPFHRCCTLACCKPRIRRVARPGDWVVGITPKRLGHRLAYAMKVGEVLGYADYWRLFPRKRPDWHAKDQTDRVGDNCYVHGGGMYIRSLASIHNDPTKPLARREASVRRDLSGKNVLVARRFAYFGGHAVDLHASLPIPARGHRVLVVSEGDNQPAIAFLEGLAQGRRAAPRDWDEDDRRATGCESPRCG